MKYRKACLLLSFILIFSSVGFAQESDKTDASSNIEKLITLLKKEESAKAAKKQLLKLDKAGYRILKKKLKTAKPESKAALLSILKGLRRTHLIWGFSARQKAKDHLKSTPRKGITAGPPPHKLKVCKLLDERKNAALKKAFPFHKFFEFEWARFSGEMDPIMYVAVSIDGDIKELEVYDDEFLKFFKNELQITVKTEKQALIVLNSFRSLEGKDLDPQCKTKKNKKGGISISTIPRERDETLRFDFDKKGKVVKLGYLETDED